MIWILSLSSANELVQDLAIYRPKRFTSCHVIKFQISDDQPSIIDRRLKRLKPFGIVEIDLLELTERIFQLSSLFDVIVDIDYFGDVVPFNGCAHRLGNLTSTAVAYRLDGAVNLISAPYSSNMLRVMVRPRPMPWPSLASTLAVVVLTGSNQRSAVSSVTVFPVFSIRKTRAPSCSSPATRMAPR